MVPVNASPRGYVCVPFESIMVSCSMISTTHRLMKAVSVTKKRRRPTQWPRIRGQLSSSSPCCSETLFSLLYRRSTETYQKSRFFVRERSRRRLDEVRYRAAARRGFPPNWRREAPTLKGSIECRARRGERSVTRGTWTLLDVDAAGRELLPTARRGPNAEKASRAASSAAKASSTR